jgi:hypothetical protein
MTSSHHHAFVIAAAATVAVLSVALGLAPATQAQAPSTALVPPPESVTAPPAPDPEERASIEREASIASALYVVSAVGLGVSAVLELTAVFMVLEGSPESSWGPGSGGLKTFELLAAVGGVVGGIGIIALPIAIGLHVDSHSRRDALERGTCTRLSITPNGVVLSGTF